MQLAISIFYMFLRSLILTAISSTESDWIISQSLYVTLWCSFNIFSESLTFLSLCFRVISLLHCLHFVLMTICIDLYSFQEFLYLFFVYRVFIYFSTSDWFIYKNIIRQYISHAIDILQSAMPYIMLKYFYNRQCFTSCYRHFTIYNGLHHIINILQSTMFYIILSTFYNRQCFTTYYQHFTIDNVLPHVIYIILSTFYNRQCSTSCYRHFTTDNVLHHVIDILQ